MLSGAYTEHSCSKVRVRPKHLHNPIRDQLSTVCQYIVQSDIAADLQDTSTIVDIYRDLRLLLSRNSKMCHNRNEKECDALRASDHYWLMSMIDRYIDEGENTHHSIDHCNAESDNFRPLLNHTSSNRL